MPYLPTIVSVFDMEPRKYGSVEQYAVALSAALTAAGWCSVMSFVSRPEGIVEAKLRESGTVIEQLQIVGNRRLHSQLFHLLRRYKPEVVHLHFCEQFSLLPMVTRLAGPKLSVFTDHYRQPQQLAASTRVQLWGWNRIVPPLFNPKLLAVSEHVKRTLVDFYYVDPSRVTVVENGVDPARFRTATDQDVARLRGELRLPPDAPVVVAVAMLIPQKGIQYLLEAAPQVLASQPDAWFVIVGEGAYLPELKRIAFDLGVEERVKFTGVRSDVPVFLALADVVAVPSVWHEPAGLIVLEAMASARPVVATASGGIPEYVVDGETGFLVELRNAQQLASALTSVLADPVRARAMGQAGRRRVEANFTTARWVDKTLAVYEEAADLRIRAHAAEENEVLARR
jgi:glycosyltransferase involved in cell wall biosynthesis